MKKLLALFSILFVLGLSNSFSQPFVNIPDANFAAWLNNNYPTCMNGNEMNTTCPAILSATNVNVQSYNISDLTGIEHFTSLLFLNCSFNQISFLPTLPPNLINLNCLGNQLTSLPELPQGLLFIDFSSNFNLTSIAGWPANIQSIAMGSTALTVAAIPTFPETVTFLSLQGLQLTELPTLPPNVNTLFIGSNPLGTLPELPISITNLAVNSCNLTELPELPPFLESLTCLSNNLTSLPVLPETMVGMQCQDNQISSIPNLPDGMNMIIMNNNQLTELPPLPSALTYFECNNNLLTQLPELPPLLNNFYCQNNLLTSFPEIPASMLILNASYNQITCWPTIPNMPSPNLSNNPFTCLPNYIPSMGVFGLLDYPLCEDGDLTNNPFGCESAKGVSGKIYADDNTDCDQNNGESGMVNVPLRLFDSQGNFVSLTSSAGNGVYFLSADTLEYSVSVDVEDKPYQASCTDPGSEAELSFTPTAQLIQGVDFGMECVPGFDIGVQSAVTTGIIFPGQPHTLKVEAGDLSSWYGLACAAGVSGTVSISIDGPVNYLNPAAGALTPNIAIDNNFSYDIADFGALNMQSAFELMLETDTTAQADNIVCVTITVSPTMDDNNPGNNTYQYCYTVVNSYDPNIKTVWPGNVEPGYDGYFNYTIYFQNTGNAPAFNVRLADTLDTNLDLSSFQITNYSHPVLTYLNGNVLTFRFNNIMLPDSSSNPEGSIGFVQYKIKPIADLPVGTVIENTAHIFFDFNDAIVTNTTQNEFEILTSLSDHRKEIVQVYPNPGTGIFNLKWNNANSANTIIEVYDIRGERIINTSINQQPITLD
jgi:uncharacterized repeat protein (TIGR01451 family)